MMEGENVEGSRFCGPIVGEGSRPRPAAAGSLPKPITFYHDGRKYTRGLTHVLAARGDGRPPGMAPRGPDHPPRQPVAAKAWRKGKRGFSIILSP
jgi:hypothetical protein